jgi:hypothetical protein
MAEEPPSLAYIATGCTAGVEDGHMMVYLVIHLVKVTVARE